MTCKICKEEMEFDSTEGIGITEQHIYTCTCDTVLIKHGTGEWECHR